MSKKRPEPTQPVVYIDEHSHRTCSDEGAVEPIRRYKTVRATSNHTDYELDDGSDEVLIRRITNGYQYNKPRVFTSLRAAWAERIDHLQSSVESAERAVISERKSLENAKRNLPKAKARLAAAKKLAAKAVAS